MLGTSFNEQGKLENLQAKFRGGSESAWQCLLLKARGVSL